LLVPAGGAFSDPDARIAWCSSGPARGAPCKNQMREPPRMPWSMMPGRLQLPAALRALSCNSRSGRC
jgi:hypothetical protein